ncbi:MAG: superoxide dismutase family protein, partial [Bacteroidota bacterium]
MKKLRSGLVSLALLSIVACKDDAKKAATEEVVEEVKEVVEEIPEEPKIVEMVLESKSGSTASGKIAFYEQNGEVTMEAALTSLDAGMHAIHIHEKADCSSADGKSSGGH